MKKKYILSICISAAILLILITTVILISSSQPNSYQENLSQQDYAAQVEERVHFYTNQARIRNGLKPLEVDSQLSDIARAHSNDMAEYNYFAHEDRKGRLATERVRDAGYNTTKTLPNGETRDYIHENAAHNLMYKRLSEENGIKNYSDWKTPDEVAKESVDALMASESHRTHILHNEKDREGIGVGITNNYEIYITQVFW